MSFEQETGIPMMYPNLSDTFESHKLEKPKVLALAHSTNLAGAQLAIASLIKNTSEQLDWSVVCPNNGPFVDKIDSYAEVLMADGYPWWCRGSAYTQAPTDFSVAKLNEVLDDVPYDYALTNTITIPWLAYHARIKNKPHMWYIHEYGDIDHGLKFALGYDESVSYISRISDTVMTVSKSVGDHLLKHGASIDNLRYISQSFDVEDYLNLEAPNGEEELLILGSIKKSKGQLEGLVGFNGSSIKDSHRLTIAGPVTEPGYAEDIEQYIKANGLQKKVNFVPKRVDALDYMQRASAVLVCSRNEALGRITLEALAAGRVVVGSDGGGTETLLSDSRGILYDGSAEDLTRRLDNLEEVSNILKPAEQRRQYIIDNFSPENERNDFLEAMLAAERHHSDFGYATSLYKMGKTGIFNAMRERDIIT